MRNRGGRWARWVAFVFLCGCGGKSLDHSVPDAGKEPAGGGTQTHASGDSDASIGAGGSPSRQAGNGGVPAGNAGFRSGNAGFPSGNAGFPSGNAGASSSPPTASCTSNDLPIAFAPMYSAYIPGGAHQFQLPVVLASGGGGSVRWGASDPSMVRVDAGTTAGSVLLTMLGAGDVTITANANGRCGASMLHITAATEAEWQAGNARYNNMNPLPMITVDGGIPGPGLPNVDPPGAPPACTNCHGDTATGSLVTITETPSQVGGFSDQELIGIVTKGSVPAGGFFDPSVIPQFAWSFFHKWTDIMGDDAQGMVVYLRSLSPSPQPTRVTPSSGPSSAGGAPATPTPPP